MIASWESKWTISVCSKFIYLIKLNLINLVHTTASASLFVLSGLCFNIPRQRFFSPTSVHILMWWYHLTKWTEVQTSADGQMDGQTMRLLELFTEPKNETSSSSIEIIQIWTCTLPIYIKLDWATNNYNILPGRVLRVSCDEKTKRS